MPCGRSACTAWNHDSANRPNRSVLFCSRRVRRGGVMTSQPRSVDAHLEVGEVVAYLARTLTSAERGWIEFHLADCDDCTSEVVSARRLYQANRAPVRRLAAVAAAAAAVAGIALLGPELNHHRPTDTLPVRGAEPPPAVTVVLPTDRAVLRAAPDFTWHAVPNATA